MRRHENHGTVITVPLEKKNYKIICVYSYVKNTNNYSLTMLLKCDGIDDPHYIDTQTIESTRENVRRDICLLVEKADSINFFDKYIERQNYQLKCFDVGIEQLEVK